MLEVPKISVLLAFLSKNRPKQGYIASLIAAISSKDGLDCRHRSESDFGERFSEDNGFAEGADMEAVLTGRDRRLAGADEECIGADGMKLFLLNSG